MTQFFNDKVVWITGASSGIGEAMAVAMASHGANLILSSRNVEELDRVRASCSSLERVKILPLDLSVPDSLAAKVGTAISFYGHIDIMVHNGGISQRSLVADTGIEVHRHVMELDYFSYVVLTKELLPHFTERKAGHFVVTSSVMGKIGTPMRSAYAAAKHAQHGFFDCLRAEVTPYQIKVTILTPGYIRTNISRHLATDKGYDVHSDSKDVNNGLTPQKAARQILRAIKKGSYESYIGKFGGEKIGLWLNRFTPGLFTRIAVKLTPK
jgi:dehydrogenase/reductase SDR family protein 7B